MAHHSMWPADSTRSSQSDSGPPEGGLDEIPRLPDMTGMDDSVIAKRGSDFAELVAKLEAHSGGKIPEGLTGELALDIVLNEIVEQACRDTGASGAAIALARGAEMVCRASSGGNAPELGTPLDTNSGLSGACLRSREIQRCDDTLTHPDADPEVARQLGVRSVVVLPLVRGEDLIGIFEVFSGRVAAFGERDLRTLEALTERILKNAQARQSSLDAIKLAPAGSVAKTSEESAEAGIGEPTGAVLELGGDSTQELVVGEPDAEKVDEPVAIPARFDWLSALMSAVIVAVALLMGTVFAIRMGWVKASGHRHLARVVPAVSSSPATSAMLAPRQTNANPPVPESKTAADGPAKSATSPPQPRTENERLPEGGLRVLENGKEIFRMPPAGLDVSGATPSGKSAKSNTALQPASIVELNPDAAEGSVIERVEPDYPEQALAQRLQGPVLLDVHIGANGAVQDIKVVSGAPELAEAATAAVRQWKFKPHVVNGRAVEMNTQITLKFTLPAS
jgi:TonB family protein